MSSHTQTTRGHSANVPQIKYTSAGGFIALKPSNEVHDIVNVLNEVRDRTLNHRDHRARPSTTIKMEPTTTETKVVTKRGMNSESVDERPQSSNIKKTQYHRDMDPPAPEVHDVVPVKDIWTLSQPQDALAEQQRLEYGPRPTVADYSSMVFWGKLEYMDAMRESLTDSAETSQRRGDRMWSGLLDERSNRLHGVAHMKDMVDLHQTASQVSEDALRRERVQNNKLREELAAAEGKVDEMRTYVTEMESALLSTRRAHESAESKLKCVLVDNESIVTMLQTELDTLKQTLATSSRAYDILKANVDMSRKAAESAYKEQEKLKKELESYKHLQNVAAACTETVPKWFFERREAQLIEKAKSEYNALLAFSSCLSTRCVRRGRILRCHEVIAMENLDVDAVTGQLYTFQGVALDAQKKKATAKEYKFTPLTFPKLSGETLGALDAVIENSLFQKGLYMWRNTARAAVQNMEMTYDLLTSIYGSIPVNATPGGGNYRELIHKAIKGYSNSVTPYATQLVKLFQEGAKCIVALEEDVQKEMKELEIAKQSGLIELHLMSQKIDQYEVEHSASTRVAVELVERGWKLLEESARGALQLSQSKQSSSTSTLSFSLPGDVAIYVASPIHACQVTQLDDLLERGITQADLTLELISAFYKHLTAPKPEELNSKSILSPKSLKQLNGKLLDTLAELERTKHDLEVSQRKSAHLEKETKEIRQQLLQQKGADKEARKEMMDRIAERFRSEVPSPTPGGSSTTPVKPSEAVVPSPTDGVEEMLPIQTRSVAVQTMAEIPEIGGLRASRSLLPPPKKSDTDTSTWSILSKVNKAVSRNKTTTRTPQFLGSPLPLVDEPPSPKKIMPGTRSLSIMLLESPRSPGLSPREQERTKSKLSPELERKIRQRKVQGPRIKEVIRNIYTINTMKNMNPK